MQFAVGSKARVKNRPGNLQICAPNQLKGHIGMVEMVEDDPDGISYLMKFPDVRGRGLCLCMDTWWLHHDDLEPTHVGIFGLLRLLGLGLESRIKKIGRMGKDGSGSGRR